VVFAANILGVAGSAYVLANTGVFSPEAAAAAASEIGHHFFELSWADIFWKGVFAGVLIAGVVWLIHAARDTAARVLIVFALAYAVGAAELAHCIVGSAETLYVVFNGEESLWAFLTHFLAPATAGFRTETVGCSNSAGRSGSSATTSAARSRPRFLIRTTVLKPIVGFHIGDRNCYSRPNVRFSMMRVVDAIRRLLAHRSVAALVGLQLVLTGAVIVTQGTGFSAISYTLGIVPEVGIIVSILIARILPIPTLLEATFPLNVALLLAAYYLVAVVLAVPGRAVGQLARRDSAA
jgi:hypothetical protein